MVRTTDPFDEMLDRHRGLLYTLGRRYTRRSIDFDDLLQEATLALWRAKERIMTIQEGLPRAAMIWKTARNAMIDYTRRIHQTEALPEGLEMADEDRSLVNELHAQINLLNEPDRTIVTRQLQGYSYEEIAEEFGMTEKNVSVRLVRIREKLRGMMGVKG